MVGVARLALLGLVEVHDGALGRIRVHAQLRLVPVLDGLKVFHGVKLEEMRSSAVATSRLEAVALRLWTGQIEALVG